MIKKRSRFLTNMGITLVELSIAAAVLFIAILPLFLLLNRTVKEVMFYNRSTAATKLGQDLIEEILSMPQWDENAAPGKAIALGSATAAGSLGADAGEPPFDDIDDYNGVNDDQTSGSGSKFHRRVVVDYVAIADGNVTINDIAAGAPTDYKRVRVIVTWPQLDTNFQYRKPVEIMTIVANVDKY